MLKLIQCNMEKIELTADEIKVIKQQLNGEIEVWNADDYQQKHLTSVIDKANALLEELDAYDEMDAELCIKDQWNLSIAKIHLGDVESSNILCEEIARRWNEFEEWHECKENTNDVPKRNTPCLLRVEYKEIATGIVEIGYLTSVWNEYGWTEDYLDNFDKSEFEVTITHWKPINKPKGVEE